MWQVINKLAHRKVEGPLHYVLIPRALLRVLLLRAESRKGETKKKRTRQRKLWHSERVQYLTILLALLGKLRPELSLYGLNTSAKRIPWMPAPRERGGPWLISRPGMPPPFIAGSIAKWNQAVKNPLPGIKVVPPRLFSL